MYNNNKLGLDQQPAVNRDVEKTQEFMLNDARPPIEHTSPALNVNKDIREGYIKGGTVLSSTTYNISDGGTHCVSRSGIQQVENYSRNEYEQAELRTRQEYQRQLQGKGIHQQSPTSGGFTPYEPVDDGVKPSPAEIERIRKEEKYQSLKRKVANLKQEEQRQEGKLAATRRVITQLRTELEELEEN